MKLSFGGDHLRMVLSSNVLKDVDGALIVSTSDEHISIPQYVKETNVDGALIVSTPQEVSIIHVRNEINFCKKVGIPVLGVEENMSGIRQPLSNFIFKKITNAGEEEDVTEETLENIETNAPHLLSLLAYTEIFYVVVVELSRWPKTCKVQFLLLIFERQAIQIDINYGIY